LSARGPSDTYAETVYQQLRDEMFAGVLRPGDRLAETHLAKRMGTSQGPVREALARLRAQGLVVNSPHRGSFVSEISLEEVKHVYEIRRLLERYAMALALPNMGDAEYRLLESDIKEIQKHAKAKRIAEQYAADMQFHSRIYEWSGSVTLVHFWETIEAKIRKFAITHTPSVFAGDPEGPARTHEALMVQMKKGYSPALEKELDKHLAVIWERIGERL
jgi:DNA-binding GntR family transcriptional regulator